MKYLIANWKMNSVEIELWEQEFINVVSSQNNFPKSDEVKLIVCLNLYDYTVFSEKIKNSKNNLQNKKIISRIGYLNLRTNSSKTDSEIDISNPITDSPLAEGICWAGAPKIRTLC